MIKEFDNLVVSGAGGGKGGSSHVPTEAPNTLQSRALARVIDLISEGEIVGLVDQVNPLKSVYFDNTVAQQSNGTLNFKGVTLHQRYGLHDQASISGFSEVESTYALGGGSGLQVKTTSPVIFPISDTDVTAVRVIITIPNLSKLENDGDLVGTSVRFKISTQPNGGAYTVRLDKTITGKAVSPYQQQYRIALTGSYPINVKVERITADSTSQTLQNDSYVSSYTEIQESRLSYPDSALIGLVVNSEVFSGRVPSRSYDVKGIKVPIPSNYDPEARTYTGIWDGTFDVAWSDNPVWVLYDLLTNKRYGLGDFISADQVDKFTLYEISQYCDELVDDGFGGTEPRFTFNTVINERKEAFEVINAIVSVFRGMAFWSAGGITVSQDSPKDFTRLVSPANVIDGEFTYSGTGLKARHTAVLVSWNDPSDNYKQAIEVVEDQDLIVRYGWRSMELAAFACTSRGQANRVGRWLLDSEKYETETVVFSTGYEFADVRPGEIIAVADPMRQATRRGGRVVSYNAGTRALTIDAPYTVLADDQIYLINTDDEVETIDIVAGSSTNVVTLDTDPSGTLQPDGMYIIKSSNIVPETWRIINLREVEGHLFEVTALKYDGTKFDRIESGITLTPAPTSFLPTGAVIPPTNLAIVESLYKTNNATNTRIDIGWTASTDPRALLYRVEAKPPDDENWYTVIITSNVAAQILNAKAGLWSFRVSATQGSDQNVGQSDFLLLEDQTVVGKTAPPANVTGLSASRDFDTVTLSWESVSDIDLVGFDIRQDVDGTWANATIIAEAHVSTTIVIIAETTAMIKYLVRARDELGILSELTAEVTTTYPTINPVTNMLLYQLGTTVKILWTPPSPGSPHFKYEIRVGSTSQVWESASLVGRTDTTPFIAAASVPTNTTLRYRIKPYVEFTSGERVYGSETTADIVKFPLIDNELLFVQEEHPAWSGTLSAEMEITAGNELALKDTETFGTYEFTVNLGATARGRLYYQHVAINEALDELLIDDATMLIDDADFPITTVANALIPAIRYFLEFSPEVEFFEADYEFSSVVVRIEFRREATDDFRPVLSELTVYFNDFILQ